MGTCKINEKNVTDVLQTWATRANEEPGSYPSIDQAWLDLEQELEAGHWPGSRDERDVNTSPRRSDIWTNLPEGPDPWIYLIDGLEKWATDEGHPSVSGTDLANCLYELDLIVQQAA